MSRVTDTPLNKLVSAENAAQLRSIMLQHVVLNDHYFVSPYYSPVFQDRMELQTVANVPLVVDTMCALPCPFLAVATAPVAVAMHASNPHDAL